MRSLLIVILNLYITLAQSQVTFIIESVPNTTPQEDTIFISGTFNNWDVNNKKFMFHTRLDGKYFITIPEDTGKIEFKFTRGSWLKVETNEKNEYCPNRTFVFGEKKEYYTKIINWQDLGGAKSFNYIIYILFFVAIYGITLMLYVLTLQKKNKFLYKTFFLQSAFLIIALIGSILYNQTNLIWQTNIKMFGLVFLFVWGPTLYFYLNSIQYKKKHSNFIVHYIPAIFILIWAFLRILNFKPLLFLSKEIYSNVTIDNALVISSGIILNLIYLLKLEKNIRLTPFNYKELSRELSLTNIIYIINSIALFLYLLNFSVLLSGHTFLLAKNYEIIILILSTIIFFEFYYYWKYPELIQNEVFSIKEQYYINAENSKKEKEISLKTDSNNSSDELKSKLIFEMSMNKLYKDPNLNIAKLSETLNVKTHVLSKLINEEFNSNFRDYINKYRVNEFIELAISEKYKNYTFIALGYEVGFNSKSTFNLAFKKNTGLSPGEFLKKNKEKFEKPPL